MQFAQVKLVYNKYRLHMYTKGEVAKSLGSQARSRGVQSAAACTMTTQNSKSC